MKLKIILGALVFWNLIPGVNGNCGAITSCTDCNTSDCVFVGFFDGPAKCVSLDKFEDLAQSVRIVYNSPGRCLAYLKRGSSRSDPFPVASDVQVPSVKPELDNPKKGLIQSKDHISEVRAPEEEVSATELTLVDATTISSVTVLDRPILTDFAPFSAFTCKKGYKESLQDKLQRNLCRGEQLFGRWSAIHPHAPIRRMIDGMSIPSLQRCKILQWRRKNC